MQTEKSRGNLQELVGQGQMVHVLLLSTPGLVSLGAQGHDNLKKKKKQRLIHCGFTFLILSADKLRFAS